MQKGLKPTDSTVSVFVGLRYIQEGFGPRDTWEAKFRRCLAATAYLPPLVVLDPIVARLFQSRGINSKQELIDWCAENARLPARDYWDDQWMQTLVRPRAAAGVEPYATQLKAAPDEIVQMYEPERHQRRRGRRRDPGRMENIRRQLRHDRLGRCLAVSGFGSMAVCRARGRAADGADSE